MPPAQGAPSRPPRAVPRPAPPTPRRWALACLALSFTALPVGADETVKASLVLQVGHAQALSAVSFSADGRLLLTSDDGAACLWDLASGLELRRFSTGIGGETWMRAGISRDGSRVLTASAGSTQLWNARDGSRLGQWEGDRGATFTADGRHFLHSGTLRRAADGELAAALPSLDGRRVRHSAFTPDGRFLVTVEEKARVANVYDLSERRARPPLTGHAGEIRALAAGTKGSEVITGAVDGGANVWDVASGAVLRRIEANGLAWFDAVALDSKAGVALTAGHAATPAVWALATTSAIRSLGLEGRVISLALSPDGRLAAVARGRTAELWDVETGSLVRTFGARSARILFAAWSGDGTRLLTGDDHGGAHLWDLEEGQERLRFTGHAVWVNAGSFSPDGRRAITAGRDRTARVWSTDSGVELGRFQVLPSTMSPARFTADGRGILTTDRDGVPVILSASDGSLLRRFEGHTERVVSMALAPGDGALLLTGGADATARVWDVRTGVELSRLGGHDGEVRAVAWSPTKDRILTAAGYDGTAKLWTPGPEGWEAVRLSGAAGTVGAVTFALGGRVALTAGEDGQIRLWDGRTGEARGTLDGHTAAVSSLDVSPDGRRVASASFDGTARIWHLDDAGSGGREVLRLVSFDDGRWAAVAPDGRFDASRLDEFEGLHWVATDDPFHPLPLEIFLRDYFEPGLVPRALAGERLPPLRSVAELDRLQPGVAVVEVRREDPTGDTISVTVEVEEISGGVYDLRLFRDGRIVGEFPEPNDALPGDDVEAWRRATELRLDPRTHRRRVTFRGIALPRREGVTATVLSAYAFNRDRVKSATARRRFDLPADLPPRPGRAYVISVGVDAFEDPAWNLDFAVNDARRTRATLREWLEANVLPRPGTPRFEELVTVALTAPRPGDEGQGDPPELLASKGNVRAALQRLSGAAPSSAAGPPPAGLENLRPARSEDLVVITFSTHGVVDSEGRFHLLPHDVGRGAHRGGPARPAQTISSDELTAWMRRVDAGELLLVVDACQSAATVAAEGFKPGPLGSRGLGQLAYDKRMRVLAATQSDQAAIESASTRMGLLTYALIRDGLEEGGADHGPVDGRISLGEWLRYAVKRVPALYEAARSGRLHGARGIDLLDPGASTRAQRPALFDFGAGDDVVFSLRSYPL